MAGRLRSPRIRMPRVVLPTRSRGAGRAGASEAPTKPSGAAKTGAETKEQAPTKEAAPKTAASRKAAAPDLAERIQGLQGWMAELERKQARLTYFGIAGIVIALLAAGAALYFGLTAHSDSAKKSDLDALSKRVDSLEGAVAKNSKDTQATLNDTVNRLQASITAIQKQQAQSAASITALQSQAAAGAFNSKGAGATTGTTATPTTPGAKTKTSP
jgi:polyhydroxyalkanoate synthesis regulator phasin